MGAATPSEWVRQLRQVRAVHCPQIDALEGWNETHLLPAVDREIIRQDSIEVISRASREIPLLIHLPDFHGARGVMDDRRRLVRPASRGTIRLASAVIESRPLMSVRTTERFEREPDICAMPWRADRREAHWTPAW